MENVFSVSKGFLYGVPGVLIAVVAFFLFSGFSCSTNKINPPIKTAAYWTSPTMSMEQATALAKHDLVIVDMENRINNRESLKLLKKINSDVKLICYSNPMEFFATMPANRVIQSAWKTRAEKKWFLKTSDGDSAVFYPGMIMMNLSDLCPKVNNQTYSDWMAARILESAISDPIWDGYFMDNGGGNISWLYSGTTTHLDINGDGLLDDSRDIDAAWSNGISNFLGKIRKAKGPDFILMANKGSVEFMDVLNGRMFEKFPNDYLGSNRNFGWNQSMENAEKMISAGAKYTIFQVSVQDLNLGLASSLLLDDVYIAIGQDNLIFPEVLNADPGVPMGTYMKSGDDVYYRDFSNISVEVRPSIRKANVSLLGGEIANK